MQNLNLDAYGVSEISEVEMIATEGGHPALLVLGALAILGIGMYAAYQLGYANGQIDCYREQTNTMNNFTTAGGGN